MSTAEIKRDTKGRFLRGISSSPKTQFQKGKPSPRKGVKKEGWINKTSFRKKPFTLLWKSDPAEYTRIHRWIVSKKGTPMYCYLCKDRDKGDYDWANVSGTYKRKINDWMRLCIRCHTRYDHRQAKIFKIIQLLTQNFNKNKPCLIAGNGGSLSLSDHMACEFVGKFEKERRALPAISLNFTSAITAIANDYSFDDVFARQIEAYGHWGGVFIAMTTSDARGDLRHSRNILLAVQRAKQIGLSVCIIGSYKTKSLRQYADILLKVDGESTDEIQNNHLKVIHTICREVESNIYYG